MHCAIVEVYKGTGELEVTVLQFTFGYSEWTLEIQQLNSVFSKTSTEIVGKGQHVVEVWLWTSASVKLMVTKTCQ